MDVEYQDSMDYMDAVYTATMQGETFPDIYMIGSDELEEAYLYGLAAENTASDIYESTVAVECSDSVHLQRENVCVSIKL